MRKAATGEVLICDLCEMEVAVVEGGQARRWLAIRMNTCGPGRCVNLVRDICPSCVGKVAYHSHESWNGAPVIVAGVV